MNKKYVFSIYFIVNCSEYCQSSCIKIIWVATNVFQWNFFSCPTLSAAVASVLYEIKLVTNANENLQKEKEKIKSDLIKSDQRSSALALEVDEQQEKQDQIVAAQIEVILI